VVHFTAFFEATTVSIQAIDVEGLGMPEVLINGETGF
jgi:hypothetical protein